LAVVNVSAELLPQTAGGRYSSMHMDMNVFTMALTMGAMQSHASTFMTKVTNHDSLYSRATTPSLNPRLGIPWILEHTVAQERVI
jgi:hypothetical protein